MLKALVIASLLVIVQCQSIAYSFGDDSSYQIGTGDTTSAPSIVRALVGKNITSISGGQQGCALSVDGTVYAWGNNMYGQLLDGSTSSRANPIPLQMTGILAGKKIKYISCTSGVSFVTTDDNIYIAGSVASNTTNGVSQVSNGEAAGKTIVSLKSNYNRAAFLDSTGSLYTWGSGGVGDNTTQTRYVPFKLGGDLTGRTVSSYCVASSHTAAVTTDGAVIVTGYSNGYGNLGNANATSMLLPTLISNLAPLAGKTFVQVECEAYSTFVLASDGTIFAFGLNMYGNLGDNSTVGRFTPVQINTPMNISTIFGGYSGSTFFLANDGVTLYGVGQNDKYQLADGTTTGRLSAVQVNTSLLQGSISSVSMYTAVGYLLSSTGNVYTWGVQNNYELARTVPLPMTSAFGPNPKLVCGGQRYSTAVLSDNTMLITGITGQGVLPVTSTTPITPMRVDMANIGTKNITNINCGPFGGSVVTSDGTVYGYASGSYGELGIGSTVATSPPIAATGALSSKKIVMSAGGFYFTLVLTSDNMLYFYGLNSDQISGDGSSAYSVNSATPVNMTSLGGRTIKSIAAGDHHAAIVTTDGSLFTYGKNDNGQLGDGTTTTRGFPVAVVGVSLVLAVSCGGSHTIAVNSNGQVYAFGNNNFGQLGDGTTTSRLQAVAVNTSGVLSGKTIVSLSAGQYHSMALASDGTIFAWGSNIFGQLGHGKGVVYESSPIIVPIQSNNTATVISAGQQQSLVITFASSATSTPSTTATPTPTLTLAPSTTTPAPSKSIAASLFNMSMLVLIATIFI